MDKSNILVSIICNTYNHEPYIRQCLEGFVMQKTNFPFEVLIHDDASTDNTADIIREYEVNYPDIIKPIYQTENQYSKKTGIMKTFQYPRVKGKYIALCEGDDYWIDSLKLQKQVDFLEKNLEYVMVYGQVKQYNQDRNKFGKLFGKPFQDTKTLFISNSIPTLTVLLKKELINKYNQEIGNFNTWLLGDYPLWLYASVHGKVGFIPSLFGVYRVLSNSASHSTDYKKKIKFVQSMFDMKLFFAKLYNIVSVQDVEQMKFSSLCNTAIQYNQILDASIYYNKIINPSFNLSIKYYLNKIQAKWLLKLIQKIRY